MHRYLLIILFLSFISADSISVRTTLSLKEQKQLIDAHNKWRAEVGTNNLQWSDELASEAQAWANKLAKKSCRIKHSSTNNGENLFWTTSKANPQEVVDSWATEKQYYKGGIVKAKDFHKYGHYTQIVWNRTKYVGCGMAVCKNGHQIWVCNYSPAGNYLGKKAY